MQRETLLRLKSAGDPWSFTGWATTSTPDLVGDVVEPAGAHFELPLPLLWQHQHDAPVGTVRDAHVAANGIRVAGRITPEAQRAVEAQALLRDGALALSVGFLAEKSEPLSTGGRRFTAWRWTELSLVSVPCNPEARIGKGLVIGQAAPPAPAARKHAPKASADVFTETMMEQFGEAIGQAINDATRPLHERIKALEAQKAMSYCGDWQEALSYQPGAVVRHAGALHILNRETQPGQAPRAGSAWTRILKEH